MTQRPAVTRERVTEAAVQLLDEDGLAGLTTRRLADRLGVRSPSLYWHVRGKDELLDLVAEAICADAFDIDAALPWRDQLLTGLRQFRAMLLRHRDAAGLLRLRPPSGPHRLGHIETTVRILSGAGFADTECAAVARLLAAHVLESVDIGPRSGSIAIPEEYAERFPALASFAALTADEVFEIGCEVLLDGLAARATRAG